jgi:hypothetical protein
MRLITTAPGQARIPEKLPPVPPVDQRYAPPGRRRLPGSFVWLLVLAGAIAGTMWMAATPRHTSCPTTPTLNQCNLQKVYLAQGMKVVAGAAGGLLVALLLEGAAGRAAAPRRRPTVAPAAAAGKPMRAPSAWGEIPSVKAPRPQLRLGAPVAAARPVLAPGALDIRMPTGPKPRNPLDLSTLPPALRDAVSAPRTDQDRRTRP